MRAICLEMILLSSLAIFFTNCGPEQIDLTPTPRESEVPPTSELTAAPTRPAATNTPVAGETDLSVPPVSRKYNRPLILAHYMPWYQTPSTSGYWGWHWTMDHFNPRETDADGRASIASHFYPLTGPYDSGDDDLLEYQALLMKISGIDGVVVDWYGFESFRDYGKINASTHKLFEHIKRAGLLFAIMYEDRTIQYMLENRYRNVDDAHVHGQQVMQYLQENWFLEEVYLKASERPVLFLFGNPPYFNSNSDWERLFSVLDVLPFLITQDDRVVSIAESAFPWPPMHLSGGEELSRDALGTYLDNFYEEASGWDYVAASAFPGFHDIYSEAGVGPSYGYLEAGDGETLEFTFQKALDSAPDIIQVVTWNDYGEGTNIEPTNEYGYQYLEMIQDIKNEIMDEESPYSAEDLEIPLQIFELRKAYKGDVQVNDRLDEAVLAVLAGRLDDARALIADH